MGCILLRIDNDDSAPHWLFKELIEEATRRKLVRKEREEQRMQELMPLL